PNSATLAANTSQLFTATVSACLNPEYLWWLFNGASWIPQGNWSPTNTFNWTPATPGNAYQVGYWARQQGTAGSNGSFDVATAVSRTVTSPSVACTSPGLVSNPNSATLAANSSMLFTASVSICPTPEFLWFVFNGTAWIPQGAWSGIITFN